MIIGIPGWLKGDMFGINADYHEYIEYSIGATDIRILSPSSPIYDDLDLLVIPGGADINPIRYGDTPGFRIGMPDPIREHFDVNVMPAYIANNTRIFGICRGMQAIAVHYRCRLRQDMYHETNRSDDPGAGVHGLRILSGNGDTKIKVNSRHHQSVIIRDNSPVEVIATHNKEHADVEAIRIKGRRIIGVQWHPENLEDLNGLRYTQSLIDELLKR